MDDTIGISLLTALSYKEDNGQYLLVASNLYKAQRIYNLLVSILGQESVLLFPADELIRAQTFAQSKEMVAQRLYVLNEIVHGRGKIVVCNLAAATRYLPSPVLFSNKTIDFAKGKTYSFDSIKKSLVSNGYSRVNKIDQSLQFAIRGDILDIYSVNNENPVRIEFFGDEVESIRFFDLATQVSIKEVDKISILPGNDILLTEEETLSAPDKIYSILEKDQKSFDYGLFEHLRNIVEEDVSQILEGQPNQKLYKYYSLITKEHYSIFDYCPQYLKVVIDEESIHQANDLMIHESFEYLSELHEKGEIISHLEMAQDFSRLLNLKAVNVITTSKFVKDRDELTFDVRNVPYQASKRGDALNIIQMYLNDSNTIVINLNKKEQIKVIEEGLIGLNISYEGVKEFSLPTKTNIGVSTLNLETGFYLPNEKIVYLTSGELFNEKVRTARFDNRFKEATILRSYEDLTPGDYVVHEYQGIGQFLELQTLEVEGVHRDYLKIAYHGGELLYVPLTQFQLVRKFIGKEGAAPRLSRLHSNDWENQKKRIKERVNDLANRLMNLYIERSKIEGFAFKKDDEFQEMFEDSFEYELTSDQEKAVKEIKDDMEKPSPMDRLLCGDVGFGKTEVAFRAVFKAIDSGKQAAILCPTTLLARQHYELAIKRFSEFGVKIAVFSRLIPEKLQNEYIRGLKDGSIHLAIGTHRLLSKDIVFKELGLLVIDEEQRFGVAQKERLKELKNNVDVLTLSATPIPRTLQISLLGVRALSKIDTAPQERMPIQTYVAPFDEGVVKELIERELGRNGQVFYMRNNISTLYQCASRLQKLLPNASIAVAHGKMLKDEIEDVMERFYNGDIDVLVCTSIVENGIDVPNANMIIVEDSEKYGLSQLYQIKGRVGRSNRIAYAYLFYSPFKQMNEKAQKRLQTLQEFTELGSGYKIARRDLMIRGAGDILGPEQAGFIDSIGLDMYIKLLNEAVQEKMGQEVTPQYNEMNVTLQIDAYIPSSFANDSDKIEIYQEILTAPSVEALLRIKARTRDIFGKLPDEVEKLFQKRTIDILKDDAKVSKISDYPQYVEMLLSKDYINIRGIGNILFEAMIPYLKTIKVSYLKNEFKIKVMKNKNWLNDLESILESLTNILATHKMKETI